MANPAKAGDAKPRGYRTLRRAKPVELPNLLGGVMYFYSNPDSLTLDPLQNFQVGVFGHTAAGDVGVVRAIHVHRPYARQRAVSSPLSDLQSYLQEDGV